MYDLPSTPCFTTCPNKGHVGINAGDYHHTFNTRTEEIEMYVHDGAGWSHLGVYSAPSGITTTGGSITSSTTWSPGSTGTGGWTGTTYTGATTTTITNPIFDVALPFSDLSEYDERSSFPSRSLFLAKEIQKHKMKRETFLTATGATVSRTMCTCSPTTLDITVPWEIHLAQMLSKASDEWDQLLMKADEDIEIDEEEI